MTRQMPQNCTSIEELLPAYVNQQTDIYTTRCIRTHLETCSTCRLALANWETMKGTVQQIAQISPLPAVTFMSDVWKKIEAAESPQTLKEKSLARILHKYWLILRFQLPLIHKSIWYASTLVSLFGLILTIIMATHARADKGQVANLLVLFIVIVGASSSAFISGATLDPGFELTIATPTSMRLIMILRMALVLGYNMLLGILVSAIFALVYKDNLWSFIQLWLNPLLFMSSLSLVISLSIGSAFAFICVAVLEMCRTFPDSILSRVIELPLPALMIDPTSPVLLLATALLLGLALFLAPQQTRLIS